MDSDDPTQPFQLLAPDGTLTEDTRFAYQGSDDDLVSMLRQILIARRFDVEGAALQRHGELALWPPLTGQEAYQAAVTQVMAEPDMVFGTYREQSIALAKGVPLADIMALWRGSSLSRWTLDDAHVSPYYLIIGAQPLHAVGYAMGVARDKAKHPTDEANNAVTLTIYGDGASSQGDVNEALVFAAAQKAPVVFLCVNNQWAISEPQTIQTPIPLYQRAMGFGIPGIRVDGNDALATHAVLTKAFDEVRNGSGPMLVEAVTYRMGPHTTSDDPTKYRASELTDEWAAKDPIERLRTHLLARGLIDQAWLDALDAELETFGARVRDTTRGLPNTPMSEVFDNVSADPGLALREERADTLDWIATRPASASQLAGAQAGGATK